MNMASTGEICVQFGPPLVEGTRYVQGECFAEEGVKFSVGPFPRSCKTLGKESCFVLIKGRPVAYYEWVGTHVELYCVSLLFDFGSTVVDVHSRYHEEILNPISKEKPDRFIEINERSRDFSYVTDLDGRSLGGVGITLDPDERNPGYGLLMLDGRIDSLTIGSDQQLCIEDLCFSRS
jgi:hypothetical protein